MKPSAKDADLLNEYLHQFNRRRAFNPRHEEELIDPVIKSVDEVRELSHDYVARLHTYLRGQVMVEAIVMACQTFLDKWAVYEGKSYNATYDGGVTGPKASIPAGPRRVSALFQAFNEDHEVLRKNVVLLREGIADIVKEGAPTWGGWVTTYVAPTIVEQTADALAK